MYYPTFRQVAGTIVTCDFFLDKIKKVKSKNNLVVSPVASRPSNEVMTIERAGAVGPRVTHASVPK